MLPYAVTPANLHLYSLNCNSGIRGVPVTRLPFSVHTSKFRSLQALFFETLTDTPRGGVHNAPNSSQNGTRRDQQIRPAPTRSGSAHSHRSSLTDHGTHPSAFCLRRVPGCRFTPFRPAPLAPIRSETRSGAGSLSTFNCRLPT